MSSVESWEENNGPKNRNGGMKGGGMKRGAEELKEIDTKTFVVQSKRFFLDVKESNGGRFIKFAELAVSGKKNRIFMSMRTANQLNVYLDKMIELAENAAKTPSLTESRLLHSETIVNDKRRYYADLRENERGQFLRVTQISMNVSHRVSVSMPALGLKELRSNLDELIAKYADDSLKVKLPDPRFFRYDNKNFYFDPDQNDRGAYLKISEVKPHAHRSTITVSSKALQQFCSILSDMQSKFESLDVTQEGNEAGDTLKKESETPVEESTAVASTEQ